MTRQRHLGAHLGCCELTKADFGPDLRLGQFLKRHLNAVQSGLDAFETSLGPGLGLDELADADVSTGLGLGELADADISAGLGLDELADADVSTGLGLDE